MAIKFSPDAMTCGLSGHSAHRDDEGAWSVSWLPGHTFGRNEAITALSIAEAFAQIADDAGTYDRLWPHITGWAAELGLGAVDVVDAAARGPVDDQAAGWTVNAAEGTAVGPSVPVVENGAVFAVLTALWDDSDGVRVSIDWHGSPDDMTAVQALALAEALRMVSATVGPQQ